MGKAVQMLSPIGMLFGGDGDRGGQVQPLPKRTDPAIQAAADRQAQIEKNKRGRTATILTGAQGVQQQEVAKTTLGA